MSILLQTSSLFLYVHPSFLLLFSYGLLSALEPLVNYFSGSITLVLVLNLRPSASLVLPLDFDKLKEPSIQVLVQVGIKLELLFVCFVTVAHSGGTIIDKRTF